MKGTDLGIKPVIESIHSPILCGAMRWTKPAENNMRQTGRETHAMY